MASLRTVVTCPRWAAFPTALRDLAWQFDLELDIQVEKHIIRETVRFKVEGKDEAIARFASILKETIEDYNSD